MTDTPTKDADCLPGQDPEARMALRVFPMPKDTNPYGSIFGGIILSYIDQAGMIEALHHGTHRWVTASIERVDFHNPVHLGDVVTLYTKVVRFGTKSVTVLVEVIAERRASSECVHVTTATVTMVSVDPKGKPIPFRTPPTLGYA